MRSYLTAAMLTAAITLSPLAAGAAPATSAAPAPAPAAAAPVVKVAPATTTAPATVKVAPAPAVAPAVKAAPAKAEAKAQTAGQQAMHERQKACGAEWQTVKGTKAAEGKTWPQYWSECNKRLKDQKN